jgi:hypothetical protein
VNTQPTNTDVNPREPLASIEYRRALDVAVWTHLLAELVYVEDIEVAEL